GPKTTDLPQALSLHHLWGKWENYWEVATGEGPMQMAKPFPIFFLGACLLLGATSATAQTVDFESNAYVVGQPIFDVDGWKRPSTGGVADFSIRGDASK